MARHLHAPYVLKRYDTASVTWTAVLTYKTQDLRKMLELYGPPPDAEDRERRKRLELDAALDRMLPPGQQGYNEHDGKPAYLAYAVLAALLGVTPAKIRNTLDNHGRHRRRQRRR